MNNELKAIQLNIQVEGVQPQMPRDGGGEDDVSHPCLSQHYFKK